MLCLIYGKIKSLHNATPKRVISNGVVLLVLRAANSESFLAPSLGRNDATFFFHFIFLMILCVKLKHFLLTIKLRIKAGV